MFINHLKTRVRCPRRLALAVAVAALASATWVTPAIAGGCTFDSCPSSGPVNTQAPTLYGAANFLHPENPVSSNNGLWVAAARIDYRWWDCTIAGYCKVITDAQDYFQYAARSSDFGYFIRAQVIGSNASGSTASPLSNALPVYALW